MTPDAGRVEQITEWRARMAANADPGSLFGYGLQAIADLLFVITTHAETIRRLEGEMARKDAWINEYHKTLMQVKQRAEAAEKALANYESRFITISRFIQHIMESHSLPDICCPEIWK